MLVSQVARVHSVVWEKAQDIIEVLAAMRSQGAGAGVIAGDAGEGAALAAGCFACALGPNRSGAERTLLSGEAAG